MSLLGVNGDKSSKIGDSGQLFDGGGIDTCSGSGALVVGVVEVVFVVECVVVFVVVVVAVSVVEEKTGEGVVVGVDDKF